MLISSFLLPLARAQGLLLVVPILVYGWIKNRRVIVYGVGGMLIGWLVYLMIMKYFTGSYWSGYLGHSMNVSQFSVENIFKPWQWFKSNFIDIKLSLHGFNTSIINRLFFAGALAIMALGYKRLDKPMWSYLAVGFIVPAMLGQFMSYPRLIVAVVPMYICLVKVFKNLKYLYLIPALILQMLFLIMHVLNFWVA